jgi:flavorubredoxin/flavin reductase (DIM6/NTAB) family NADH-FMN oxidoreductase RutF
MTATLLKPRDVQILPIAPDTTIMRSRSWNRLRFEIEYALERGTTANSFIISSDKKAIVDPPGESFTEVYLEALLQRFDPQRVEYVILGHVNPNRATTLKALLELLPHLTFVCSNPGAIALRNALPEQELNVLVMRGSPDEVLDLGGGHQLQFIPTPTPRYPDSLCTYDPKTQVMYTDKLFGAHVCGDQVFDEGWTVLREDRRYYYDCLMAPHARQVTSALEKITPFPVRFYVPGHGPLVRYGLTELVQSYQQWSQQQKSQEQTVALLYASAYGNTATLAQAIARGITKAGVSVESINCEAVEPNEIQAIVEKCAGFIIGSPTLGGHAPTQIQTALGILLSTVSIDKPAGVFGSYGWSGEAIDLLETKLRDAGYRFGFDPIRVKFKPTDATLKLCEEAGTDFAQALKKAKKVREPRQPASTLQQAVGRIVGSLCVVTTRYGDLSSAMLASWVSQATFNPPGITVAVAKERAIESLLYPGHSFALNILEEGNHLGLMKHFLKPFAPAEDRFIGAATQLGENGSPVLKEALAYLECQVNSRMECGDHWVVYATVDRGKVLNTEGKTAIHHRKSGSHY